MTKRWVCAECEFIGAEEDANPDRDWCGECLRDWPSSERLCPGCGADSLCGACPICAASYFEDARTFDGGATEAGRLALKGTEGRGNV